MNQGVRIVYLGKTAVLDPKTHEAKIYTMGYEYNSGINWKECMVQELKKILDKYEGIKEIRFYVP